MNSPSNSKSQPLKLGDLMVRDGLMTTDGLNKALAIQRQGARSGQYKPLGQVCVDLRLITRQDLQRFLGRYHKHIQIGELLVNMGVINQEQLNRVLDHQRVSSTSRIGTLLVQLNIITESQLSDALSMQLGIPRIVPLFDLISPELLEGLDEHFVRQHICLPIHRQGNQLVVVMGDPLNSDTLQALIDLYRCKIVPAIAPASEILATIKEIFSPRNEPLVQPASEKTDAGAQPGEVKKSGPPSVDAVREQITNVSNVLLRSALEANASAVHVETHEHYLRVRLRVSGLLKHLTDLPLQLGPQLIEALTTPFSGRPLDDNTITTRIGDTRVEMGLSLFQSRWGDNVVLQIFPGPTHLLGLENLGFSPLNAKLFQRLLDQAGGIIMAVGPQASGRSTLLAASLGYLNHPERSLLTLETGPSHPIPGLLEGIVSQEQGFNNRFRAMISHDADILMVSELKDRPTADFIGQAALQGKKLLTSLNACDATAGLYRLIQLQARPLLESPVPIALVAQRLVRRLCESCKLAYSPSEDELRQQRLTPMAGETFPFYRAAGCPECNQQGYRGLTALHEILTLNDSFHDALAHGASAAGLRRLARSEGQLVFMAEDGLYKALQGITSLEEIRRVVSYPDSQPAQTQRDIYTLCHHTEELP